MRRHGDRYQDRQSNYGQAWLPSLNEWGIPDLLPHLQAEAVPEAGWRKWGEQGRCRKSPDGMGLHFYCEDYKFSGLWSRPGQVITAGWPVAVEVNYSTGEGMPRAWVLYNVYRKRYLARLWEESGVRILVDLNVEPEAADLALIGVPRGWRAYATRAWDTRPDLLEHDYEMAARHAGTQGVLFVVFGGHDPTARLCGERGWHHVREHAEVIAWGEVEAVGVVGAV